MKWVSINEAPVYNIELMRNQVSSYDGSLYSSCPRITSVIGAGPAVHDEGACSVTTLHTVNPTLTALGLNSYV
jgi:hypothetical protein